MVILSDSVTIQSSAYVFAKEVSVDTLKPLNLPLNIVLFMQ